MSALYDITADFLRRNNYRPIHAGDDYDHTFVVDRAGAPLNLVGAKLWITLKTSSQDSDASAKLQYTSSDPLDIEVTEPAAGRFIVHFHAADTASLEGTWDYDIKAKLSTTKIIRIARGVIQFLPSITQATS